MSEDLPDGGGALGAGGEEGAPGEDRRVRQRVARSMSPRVNLTRENVKVISSPLPGVQGRTELGPACKIVSLEHHLKNGARYNTMIIAMVMTIRSSSENNQTMVQQRFGGGGRGQREPVRYQ